VVARGRQTGLWRGSVASINWGGLGPAEAEGTDAARPVPLCPSAAAGKRRPAGQHVLIVVGRKLPLAAPGLAGLALRQLQGSLELLVVEPDPKAGRWPAS